MNRAPQQSLQDCGSPLPERQGVCNKCGYCGPIGPQGQHPNCNYQAFALTPKHRVSAEDMERFRKVCAGGYISNGDAISIILNLIDDLTDARAPKENAAEITDAHIGAALEGAFICSNCGAGPAGLSAVGAIVRNRLLDHCGAQIVSAPQRSYGDQLKRANRIIGWMMPYIGNMCPPPNGLYDLNLHCLENDVPDAPETTKGAPLNQRAELTQPQGEKG